MRNKLMMQDPDDLTQVSNLSKNLAQALPRLTPGQVAQISPRLRRESYASEEFIIRQSQPATCFFIIVEGQAEVWHMDQDGRNIKINSLGQGEYFGETGLIQNVPRNASVQVATGSTVEVLVLDRSDFEAMMEQSRATEMHMAREMVQRLIELANAQAKD